MHTCMIGYYYNIYMILDGLEVDTRIFLYPPKKSPGNNNIIVLLVTKHVEYTILFWPPKALYRIWTMI